MVSLGERLGQWIDIFLQPLVQSLPGFLKDTGDTIAKIQDITSKIQDITWSANFSWLSCDVVALYPSIPHDQALMVLHSHLVRFSAFSTELIDFIVLAVEFLLHHNYFMFDGQFFLQWRGASMGARFSPSFANIFMAAWVPPDLPYQMVREVYRRPAYDMGGFFHRSPQISRLFEY